MKEELKTWLTQPFNLRYRGLTTQMTYDPSRVRIMETSFSSAWGHSSLVMAEMAGYFELLDMNPDWEYVLNISGFDFPLASNYEIYKKLRINGKSNWMRYFTSPAENKSRIEGTPCFMSKCGFAGKSLVSNSKHPDLKNPDDDLKKIYKTTVSKHAKSFATKKLNMPFPNWILYKHDQWTILHRSFIKTIRNSPTAMTFLAFLEFTFVADESYFATLGANLITIDPDSPGKLYNVRFINNRKRYIQMKWCHAKMVTNEDRQKLKERIYAGDVFTRKIDIAQQPELVQFLRRQRKFE